MMLSTIRMKVGSAGREALLQAVHKKLETISVASGCISCRFYQDTEKKNSFMLVQAWESRKDLDNSFGLVLLKILLPVVELLAKPPDVRIIAASSTEQFEDMNTARASHKRKRRTRSRRDYSEACSCASGSVLDGRIGYGLRSGI